MSYETSSTTLLFALADALAIPLSLHQSGKISGQQHFSVEAGGHDIEFTAKVVSSMRDISKASVLVKVRKRLWVHLSNDKKEGKLTLLLVDAEKAGFHETGPNDQAALHAGKLSLEEFMLNYAGSVAAMFTRPVSEAKWSVHEFNPVDERQAKTTGKGAGVPV